LNDTVKGRFVVYDRDDLMECALILKNALERKLDRINIPTNCLDVLAQHIYGICIEGRTYIENVRSLIKQSYCYKDLSKKDFMAVVKYLAGDYAQLEYRRVYSKVWYDEDTGEMGKRGKLARVLYATNIGTIPDEAHVQVKIGEQVVGYIDEAFLERLKKGDIFVLGGSVYEYRYARGMTLQVASAVGRIPTVPSWFSDMLPLSFDLAMSIQRFRRLIEDRLKAKQSRKEILKFIKDYLYMDGDAANSVYEYIREQYLFSKISHDKRLLIEFYNDGANKQVVFHSCYGRRVNDVLSRAIAYAISMTKHFNVQITLTDHGFSLSADKRKLNALDGLKYLNPENLRELLEIAVDRTEVLKRRFRHCAGRSLMILRNYKGQRKTAGRQQISSQILINACREVSHDFPILKEARREVLEDLMDIKNCELLLKWLKDGKLKVGLINTQIPSPFALNIVARGYSDILKMEDKLEFIRRMHNMVLARLSLMDRNGNS
jgi:ATP-dependent Lhr-like helicase